MKHEQRPQGFVALSAAQSRPDHAAGDYAPATKLKTMLTKKQICARMTDPPMRPLLSVLQ
jgi:hypothetical protein